MFIKKNNLRFVGFLQDYSQFPVLLLIKCSSLLMDVATVASAIGFWI